jgi:DNA-binding NarL/FixJ family response regulator
VLLSALAWVQWKWRGARGCVLKSDVGRGLLAAVKALSRHEAFFSSSVSEMVLKDCQAHDGHLEHGHRCHAWQLQVLLLASGSEVYPCVDAHEKLKAR